MRRANRISDGPHVRRPAKCQCRPSIVASRRRVSRVLLSPCLVVFSSRALPPLRMAAARLCVRVMWRRRQSDKLIYIITVIIQLAARPREHTAQGARPLIWRPLIQSLHTHSITPNSIPFEARNWPPGSRVRSPFGNNRRSQFGRRAQQSRWKSQLQLQSN